MSNYPVEGQRVARLRHSKGWTQLDLATEADCTDRTVRRMESGHPVSLHTLMGVADALEVEVCELMAASEYQRLVQPNRELVDEMSAQFAQKNIDGILELMTDDVKMFYSGPPELPYAGNFQGKVELRKFFEQRFEALTWVEPPIVDAWVVTHNQVVVHAHHKSRFDNTEEDLASYYCMFFGIRDGLVEEVRHYQDHSKTLKVRGFEDGDQQDQ